VPGFFVPAPSGREPVDTCKRISARVYSTRTMTMTMTMNASCLCDKPLRIFGTISALVIIGLSANAHQDGRASLSPLTLPEHDGKPTTVPAIIVGSGPHNLRIWSEPEQQNEVNVLLGGLRAYEYVAQVTMIDLHGNTIVDQAIDTPKGFLNMQLTAETPLPKGTYLLTIRTSDRSWTDRVVVE
jgi:hypothetical protein